MIYNNRHFEINRYTNCGLNHNLQTINNCFISIYIHELFNCDMKSWKKKLHQSQGYEINHLSNDDRMTIIFSHKF